MTLSIKDWTPNGWWRVIKTGTPPVMPFPSWAEEWDLKRACDDSEHGTKVLCATWLSLKRFPSWKRAREFHWQNQKGWRQYSARVVREDALERELDQMIKRHMKGERALP